LLEIASSPVPLPAVAVYKRLAAKGIHTTRISVEQTCRRMRDQGRIKKAIRGVPGTQKVMKGWESALPSVSDETLNRQRESLLAPAMVQPLGSDSERMIELVLDLQEEGMEGIDPLQVQQGWANRYRDQKDVPTPDPGPFHQMLAEIERAQQGEKS